MASKKKEKPKSKPKPSYVASEEKKLGQQVESDIAKEKKTPYGPKYQKLEKQVLKDIKGETALSEVGMGHPDAKALIAAGIPENRVQQLTAQHAPNHPANAGTGETANPTTPAQNAADILTNAGLPDTASNELLLETQMREEGMPTSENNPLATTLAQQGSKSVNSAGVQEFPTAAEGDVADALTLKNSMPGLYNALALGNASPEQYAAALESSNYEGLGGSSNPANVAYGQTFLSDYTGQPVTGLPAGSPSTGYTGGAAGGQALTDASSQNLFGNLSSVIPNLGSSGQAQSLQQALSGLSAGSAAATEAANTTQAPGSPDQAASESQKTNVNPASNYQLALASLLPGIAPGTAGKKNG